MLKILGIIIFLVSGYGWYWTNKRSFNKNNEFGVSVFESYNEALFFKITQGIVWLASAFGLMLGFGMFVIGYGFGR